jgi:uncharacterized membrane protein
MKIQIPENNRPRIKLKRSSLDWILEFVAFAFLVILITLPLIYLKNLPETIPVHFNAAGLPDGYGSRSTLFLLPVTGIFMYLLMTILEAFPHIYNFPVVITTENAPVQYRIATRLIRILKTVILITFSFISFQTIKTATGGAAGLGKAFFPVFLLLTFVPIIFYLVKSLNNRQSS